MDQPDRLPSAPLSVAETRTIIERSARRRKGAGPVGSEWAWQHGDLMAQHQDSGSVEGPGSTLRIARCWPLRLPKTSSTLVSAVRRQGSLRLLDRAAGRDREQGRAG